jgi:ketopantoate reductase
MRTLIYGAGPIGRWLALRLHQGGADVTILARGATLETLRRDGVVIHDGFTGEPSTAKVPVVDALDPDDDYELVIVPMRKSARLEVQPILARAPGLGSILLVGNDVTGTRACLEHLPQDKVLLGFATCGGGQDGERMVMVDSSKPGGAVRPLHLGALGAPVTGPARRVAAFLQGSGVPAELEDDMEGWLMYHFAFVGPIAGVVLEAGGDLLAVAKDPDALRRFRLACRQAGDVLAACGQTRRQPPIFNLFYWIPAWLAPKVFRPIFDSPFSQVAFGLHMNAIGGELGELAEEFATLQATAGLTTPELDALLAHIHRSPG